MKNLRKVLTALIDEHITKNPAPKNVDFSNDEMRAAAIELIDGIEAIASTAANIARIATALEGIGQGLDNIEMSVRKNR